MFFGERTPLYRMADVDFFSTDGARSSKPPHTAQPGVGLACGDFFVDQSISEHDDATIKVAQRRPRSTLVCSPEPEPAGKSAIFNF